MELDVPPRQVAPATDDATPVQVFFVSDSTGISAETMGNALLLQFPGLTYERRLVPFLEGREQVAELVAELDSAALEGPVVVFSTASDAEVRRGLRRTVCPVIDFFESHVPTLEAILGLPRLGRPGRLHGIGDAIRYNARMQAVEYAIEHDDGQSVRQYDRADVILLAPSRCGKTPTTMYLALQHGVLVANYPLLPEDLGGLDLPEPVRGLRDACFGILTTPERLAQVRRERRPDSVYASEEQCAWELRRAEKLFRAQRLPTVHSATKSVEEMSTVILQHLARTRATRRSPS